jgi:hypothetical protein
LDEELAVYEYDNNAFLKLVAEDFGIKSGGSFSEVSEYAESLME